MSDTEDGVDGAEDGVDEVEDGVDGADAGTDGTDDGVDGTDDFDKEAEREKLREQYERDQKRREATQHMSDLLLKGATMTNAHCDDCGSPIFRYDGEAFCPTCAGTREVTEDAAGGGGRAGGAGESAGGAQGDVQGRAGPADDERSEEGRDVQPGTTGADPSPDRPVESPGAAAEADSGQDPGEGDGRSRPAQAGGDAGGDEAVDLEAARSRLDERAASRTPGAGGTTDRRADPQRSPDSPVRQGEVPSMAQSRASLRRAIVSLSEQAAQSDDPVRAHDLLKGAREAAEALAALEGTTGE